MSGELARRHEELVERSRALTPEFPNSSIEIFIEAGNLISQYKKLVLESSPSRMQARKLLTVLSLELDFNFPGSDNTIEEIFYILKDSNAIPEEKIAGFYVDTFSRIARRNAPLAMELLRKTKFPWWIEPSDMPLYISDAQQAYDPKGAGEAASLFLETEFDREKIMHRDEYRPRNPESKKYAAETFGWLVARYGNIELADKMAKTLDEGSVEQLALLGEIGVREPETERGGVYTERARKLLDRDIDREDDDGWIGRHRHYTYKHNYRHYKRLADAFSESNPEISSQFLQRFEEADYFGIGIPSAQVKQILTTGSFIEASRVVRTIIEADLENPFQTYPPSGIKHDLEKLLVEIARTNPQRVVALVEDNFRKTEGTFETDLTEFKIDLLVEGAKSLIEANQKRLARELLARALVVARSIRTTKPHEGELKGNELAISTQELAIPAEVLDTASLLTKAKVLAKVGAAVAKLETVSSGL